jgi:outer membrane protein
MKSKFILLLLTLLPTLVHADTETLTLDEAVQSAISNSPGLDQQRGQSELSQWQHTEALSGFLPTFAVTGHYFFDIQTPTIDANFGALSINSAPPQSPTLDGEVVFKLPLFDGFKNIDRYHSSNQLARAAELDVDYGTFSLKERVRLAYYSVVEAELLDKVADEDVKDLEDHRRLVNDRLRAGVVKKVDLLRVDTQLSNAVSEKTNADDEIEIRRQQLAQLLGAEEETRAITDTLPEPKDEINVAIHQARLGSRPDIDALQLRADAENGAHRADAKWWIPSVSFMAEAVGLRSDEIKLTSYALGLSMSWNIFDGLKSYAISKESLASEKIAMRREELRQLQARTDVATYQRRYHYNLQKYRARLADVERSSESVRLAKSGFKAGVQTSTDVLDAEQDLFDARANQIQSQYGALESLIHFELALGRNISP